MLSQGEERAGEGKMREGGGEKVGRGGPRSCFCFMSPLVFVCLFCLVLFALRRKGNREVGGGARLCGRLLGLGPRSLGSHVGLHSD